MFDDNKRITIRTEDTCHELSGTDELGSHYADRRFANLFADHCIMQTARRATASITNTSNDSIPILSLFHQMDISGSAVVGFGPADHFGYAVFFL